MKKLLPPLCVPLLLVGMVASSVRLFAAPKLTIGSPMSPPTWALLERELIRASTVACEEFYHHYFDSRGYLLCVTRWGGDDGPDDAIENLAMWPEFTRWGARVIRQMYLKAIEGHLRQYTEAKTVEVPMARDGMYYKEFSVMFDWQHNAEGLRVFNAMGLSDPNDANYRMRVRRYAGFSERRRRCAELRSEVQDHSQPAQRQSRPDATQSDGAGLDG